MRLTGDEKRSQTKEHQIYGQILFDEIYLARNNRYNEEKQKHAHIRQTEMRIFHKYDNN